MSVWGWPRHDYSTLLGKLDSLPKRWSSKAELRASPLHTRHKINCRSATPTGVDKVCYGTCQYPFEYRRWVPRGCSTCQCAQILNHLPKLLPLIRFAAQNRRVSHNFSTHSIMLDRKNSTAFLEPMNHSVIDFNLGLMSFAWQKFCS